MNIRDLKYIVAVAKERHFGRAANTCNVTQPALSFQIRKLEDYLGVSLFERTNRSVWVTPVGERIVDRAQHIVALSDEIISIAQTARNPFSGQFRLGMIPTIGPYLSPFILRAVCQDMPRLSLILTERLTVDLEARLINGELDGAILGTAPQNTCLQDIILYEEPFQIALFNNHPLAKQYETIDLQKLAHKELLLLSDGHCLREQVLDACNASEGNTETRETSLETLLALVEAGNGITLIPALCCSTIDQRYRTIVMRKETSGKIGRTVRFVFRTSFSRPEIVMKLASIICTNVPEKMVQIPQA